MIRPKDLRLEGILLSSQMFISQNCKASVLDISWPAIGCIVLALSISRDLVQKSWLLISVARETLPGQTGTPGVSIKFM